MLNSDHINDTRSKKTLLIIGVSSFVGSNLAEFLKSDYKIVGTYHKTPTSIPGVLTLPCDALSKDEVQLIMFAFKPDITIYAVGMSSVTECAVKEDFAEALNTSGLFNVSEMCQRYKSKLCYISSNFVFAGENRSYLEMDVPDASTVYGKTQASSEFYIEKTSLNYVIFRCCRLYGRGSNFNRLNFFESLQKLLHKRITIPCDDYLTTGFLDIYYLAMIMKIAFSKNVTNRILQVSTKDSCSYYEFAKKYCEIFYDSEGLITKDKWRLPLLPTVERMDDRVYLDMNSSNAEGFLKVKLPTIEESLFFTKKRLKGKESKSNSGNSGGGVKFI